MGYKKITLVAQTQLHHQTENKIMSQHNDSFAMASEDVSLTLQFCHGQQGCLTDTTVIPVIVTWPVEK